MIGHQSHPNRDDAESVRRITSSVEKLIDSGKMNYLPLVGIGLIAGILSGMFGIGGGLVIVPALLFVMDLKEYEAIGTSLAALIPPVGLLGAAAYYRSGNINIKYAALLACGLFVGAYFGAKITLGLSPGIVRKAYAVFLLLVAGKILIMGK